MDVASLIAAHWMSTDLSADCSARSRSRENVAMPHCRGGQVATKAIDRLRWGTRFGWSGIRCRRSRLGAQPVQDLSNLRGHQTDACVRSAVIQPHRAGSPAEHASARKKDVGAITLNSVLPAGTN